MAQPNPQENEPVPAAPPAAPGAGEQRQPPLTAREEWSEFLKTAVIAVLLALLIRTFLFEPFNIPSGSMKPTLEIGDYLFVYKPAYGYSKASFPFGIADFDGRIAARGKLPQRGDVVVFKLPSNPSIDYIKRVVGLPGETIQVKGGQLYINNQLVPREPLGLKEIDDDGAKVMIMEYIQTLPGGATFHIYEESDNHHLDDTAPYYVPPGHYFMMGDNRDNSQDSRVTAMVGPVPLDNMVGPAAMLFFSTNGYAGIAEFWKWPRTIRYDRLFKNIQPVRLAEPAKP